MAAVSINRGTVEATDLLSEVPESAWRTLLGARRSFVKTHLPYDCRELLRFVEDGEKMFSSLGFSDIQDFLRRGLEIDPDLVEWAVDGLRALSPDEPVAFDAAVAKGKAVAERAKEAEAKPPLAVNGQIGRGRPAQTDSIDNIKPIQGGTSADYLSRRIARDAPDVLERMKAGEFQSVRQAAIAAGIVKVPTMVERAFRLVDRMSHAERLDFDRQIRPLIEAAERSLKT